MTQAVDDFFKSHFTTPITARGKAILQNRLVAYTSLPAGSSLGMVKAMVKPEERVLKGLTQKQAEQLADFLDDVGERGAARNFRIIAQHPEAAFRTAQNLTRPEIFRTTVVNRTGLPEIQRDLISQRRGESNEDYIRRAYREEEAMNRRYLERINRLAATATGRATIERSFETARTLAERATPTRIEPVSRTGVTRTTPVIRTPVRPDTARVTNIPRIGRTPIRPYSGRTARIPRFPHSPSYPRIGRLPEPSGKDKRPIKKYPPGL